GAVAVPDHAAVGVATVTVGVVVVSDPTVAHRSSIHALTSACAKFAGSECSPVPTCVVTSAPAVRPRNGIEFCDARIVESAFEYEMNMRIPSHVDVGRSIGS